MVWINLAQDRDKWQALVDIVMDLQVPYNVRNFLTQGTVSFSSWTAASCS